MALRDGVQTDSAAYASLKMIPFFAIASICGVAAT